MIPPPSTSSSDGGSKHTTQQRDGTVITARVARITRCVCVARVLPNVSAILQYKRGLSLPLDVVGKTGVAGVVRRRRQRGRTA